MTRSPDTTFRRTFEAPYGFDEITERGSLKLTSLLRVTAPRHFDLWRSEIGGPDFFESTGLFIPIVALDLFVADHPIRMGSSLEIGITIRLGKQLDSQGRVRRLLSESVGEVHAAHAQTGERVLIARNLKINALSRNDPDPEKRRVTELPASMNLGRVPERVVSFPAVGDLAAAPAHYAEFASFADEHPHVWSYGQTDMNQHVHAMEYVRMMELFAVDQLAALDRSPRDYAIHRARVAFRKPCFTGEHYLRVGGLHTRAGDAASPDILCGALHKFDGGSRVEPAAVATQLFVGARAT